MVSIISVFLVFAGLLVVIAFFCSGFFNKNDFPLVCWSSPYECGFSSNSLSFNCFSFTYFSLLVFFVVFDLEISLLLNLPEQGLLYSNFLYYFGFLLVLCIGFFIEVITGYVRWGY